MENMTSVKCEICGKAFRRVNYKHLKHHHITVEEYKVQFPDAPMLCDELILTMRENGLRNDVLNRPEIRALATAAATGRIVSAEQREKIRQSRLGSTWGEAPERRAKQREVMLRSHEIIKTLDRSTYKPRKIRPLTDEEIARRVANCKSRIGQPSKTKGKKLNLTDEQRSNRSIKRTMYIAENNKNLFTSSLERRMADFLTENNLGFEHQYTITTDSGVWVYDFYIPSINLLIEVDGEYFHSLSKRIVNKDMIKTRIAMKSEKRFLRLSDSNFDTSLIFAEDDVMIKHNQQILETRMLKFSGNP